jgi:PIN domain nuclease of toxin-antitoxin system
LIYGEVLTSVRKPLWVSVAEQWEMQFHKEVKLGEQAEEASGVGRVMAEDMMTSKMLTPKVNSH